MLESSSTLGACSVFLLSYWISNLSMNVSASILSKKLIACSCSQIRSSLAKFFNLAAAASSFAFLEDFSN